MTKLSQHFILFLLIYFVFTFCVCAQSSLYDFLTPLKIEAFYRFDFKDDNSDNTFYINSFVLQIGADNKSKFSSHEKLLSDEFNMSSNVSKDHLNYTIDDNSAAPLNLQSELFRENDQIIHYNRVGFDIYSYTESIATILDWKISNEKKRIEGYVCQKATCSYGNKTYEAWFTKQVPIAEGPYKFKGLPGLIVKLYDLDKDYVFTLVYLKKLASNKRIIVEKSYQNSTTINKNAYHSILTKRIKNISLNLPTELGCNRYGLHNH
ncbi:GLPGLI family protein [Flammeovirga kamogawensis]|uniref:GLPGLI family protein n=1 Tax=Flammeovirga kamogawensis TaxID=373891 RepID=A0ABX8GQG9_9BACT|nr:GLPGLI family protein [Flammeovirga kamogawensis]MBB6463039.1 GLPGLI family protein [Flammeovirga kamogawensis]QWG05676.1 GLPGLI family protein [Flammeovirga kamogawensis]TRX67506.1 GLPGLI family protein [Flammeovirga kamogawensis]